MKAPRRRLQPATTSFALTTWTGHLQVAVYGCSAGKQILVALRAAARRRYGAIRYGLPDWVRQIGGYSAELDASARNSKGVRGFDSTWTTICLCLVRPWPTDPSTRCVALQEIVIARNPETMEALHRYLSGVGAASRVTPDVLDASLVARATSAVVMFPDEFDASDIVRSNTSLRASQLRLLIGLITGTPPRYRAELVPDAVSVSTGHLHLWTKRRSGRASGCFLEGEEGALSNHQLEAVRDRAATEENRIRVRALLDRPLG